MRELTDGELRWVLDSLEKISEKMVVVTERNRGIIPYTTVDGHFEDKSKTDICWWTNGFWGGEMWQLYKLTRNEMFREEAVGVEEKLDANLMVTEGLDHDNGFKWLPTSVCRYKIEKNKESYNRAMLAADNLAGRYNITGKFIRAWNNWDNVDRRGYAIIDCMMNLPLLYWASEVTTDPRYRMIAVSHADTAIEHFIREDGSVNHIVIFDPYTGEKLETPAGQGYAEGSSWTRGQSWGIYGFTLSYLYTGVTKYLTAAEKIADYVISEIPESYLIPIDYRQPKKSDLEDSTAAAITASGLIELAKATHSDKADKYLDVAIKLLRTLTEKRCDLTKDKDNILEKCAVDYHGDGHNMSIIYGDYFFIEALMKLNNKALKIF